MYNINMYSGINWWTQQKTKKAEYKAPDKCTFCSKEIKDFDFFYAGRDKHDIYAETCDSLKCHMWLEYKIYIKKVPGKDYMKEATDRVKEND